VVKDISLKLALKKIFPLSTEVIRIQLAFVKRCSTPTSSVRFSRIGMREAREKRTPAAVDVGVDFTIADNDGVTPIVHEKNRGIDKIVQILSQAGALK